jgi:hypothetical protein
MNSDAGNELENHGHVEKENSPEKKENIQINSMTLLSIFLNFFPVLVMLMVAGSILWICKSPGIFSIAALLFTIYCFPLLVFRIHEYFYPLQEGISYLIGNKYSPWWGSHQIQVIYITFPALEAGLRLIPGAFSFWLRLWGSKVGKQVYWAPHLEVADRSLLDIGDYVVFGHGVGVYSHIIKPRKNNLMLFVKKLKIGSNVFIGAWNHMAPGVEVEDGTYIPVFTHIYPNKKFK